MLKRGTYIGNDRYLQGKTAIVMTIGEKSPRGIVPEGKVMIQANDMSTGLGHGWYEFPAEDWEIEIIRAEMFDEIPQTPVARLPEMSEQERIDTGYVPISHAVRHLFVRRNRES